MHKNQLKYYQKMKKTNQINRKKYKMFKKIKNDVLTAIKNQGYQEQNVNVVLYSVITTDYQNSIHAISIMLKKEKRNYRKRM